MNKKLMSGRFWLTIITGAVFAYATVAKLLDNQAVATIITMVFISYFQRSRENGNGSPK